MEEKKEKAVSKPFIFLATTVFLLLSCLVLVAAQEKVTTIGDVGKAIGKWISDAFGYTDIKATSDWRFVAVLVVIFFMLFFAFSDIIYSFTTFGKTTAYILGFGLAVIAALTKGVLWLSRVVFGITAALGALAVAVIIVIAFVIAVLMHWWILGWVRGKIREKEVEEYAQKVRRGMKLAALIEEGAEKGKK